MPVYTLDPGLSYFQYQVYISNISTHSQKSRHEPDSSNLQAKVLSKFASVVRWCISGTLHGPDLPKANTQNFLNTQHAEHPPTGLIKIKALKNWQLLLKILPITRADWLTRKAEITGNHKIHVLLCSRYLQCKLYSHSQRHS